MLPHGVSHMREQRQGDSWEGDWLRRCLYPSKYHSLKSSENVLSDLERLLVREILRVKLGHARAGFAHFGDDILGADDAVGLQGH